MFFDQQQGAILRFQKLLIHAVLQELKQQIVSND